MFTPLPDADDGSEGGTPGGKEEDLVALRPPGVTSSSSGAHSSSPSALQGRTSCEERALRHAGLPRETCALINAAAVAVATILGTGILALPVKLAHSGMGPFILTFTLCLGTQLATGEIP